MGREGRVAARVAAERGCRRAGRERAARRASSTRAERLAAAAEELRDRLGELLRFDGTIEITLRVHARRFEPVFTDRG